MFNTNTLFFNDVFVTLYKELIMKRLGSEFEFKEERDRELIRNYRLFIMEEGEVKLFDCVEKTINSPCSRFWVSKDRATIVIQRMMHGDDLSSMTTSKQEMYREIWQRFIRAREEHPDWSTPELVGMVIKQPAPKFYMTVGSAVVFLHNIKKKSCRHIAKG